MARHVKIVNEKRGWCAVEIPRCGCTGLKHRAWIDNRAEPLPENLHAALGYGRETSGGLVVEWDFPTAGLFHFAVWRSPVERSFSTWSGLALDPEQRHPAFWTVFGCDWDGWAAFVREELSRRGADADVHLRRQRDFFHDNDVEAIVPIRNLDAWLAERFGHEPMGKVNSSRLDAPCHLSTFATEEIARLYACDSAMPLSRKFIP